VPYLPGGWTVEKNAIDNPYWINLPNRTGRYFGFDYANRKFVWAASDQYPPDWGPITPIHDEAQASRFMDELYQKLSPSNHPPQSGRH
jgi:hypothetical protein